MNLPGISLATGDKETVQFQSPATTSVSELSRLRTVAVRLKRQNRLRVRNDMTGPASSVVLGRGLDFAEVRNYQPGDDVRMIDWKVTARTGQAHTKLFVEERERPIYLVIDCRSTMKFATRGMFKSLLAARLAAVLGWTAIESGDRVGGLIITDAKLVEVRPQPGRRGLMKLFRMLEQAHMPSGSAQKPSSNDEAVGLLDVAQHLRRLIQPGSAVVFFSDFKDLGSSNEAAFGASTRTAQLLAVLVEDPLDRSLPPPGRYALSRAGERLGIDTTNARLRSLHAERHQQLIDKLQNHCGGHRARCHVVSTAVSFIESAADVLTVAPLGSQ